MDIAGSFFFSGTCKLNLYKNRSIQKSHNIIFMKQFKSITIKNLTIENPIILAPLCGITDSPFRRVCHDMGAGLSFVEMISSTAVQYNSQKTFQMMEKHPSEKNVGIQFTARFPEELQYAINAVQDRNFTIIDLNMGCPAKKVVKTGGGSAILKNPDKIYNHVKIARQTTSKPLSVKIRAGWDRNSININETSKAIEEAGADLITIHGRTREDTYAVENNLIWIKQVKDNVSIPVIGNGDLFSVKDVLMMRRQTGIDGVMLARGILGNPFLFKALTLNMDEDYIPTIQQWKEVVFKHLDYFEDFYGNDPAKVVKMRKHLLWYCKGWRDIKKIKVVLSQITDLNDARRIIDEYVKTYPGMIAGEAE
jgi:tRNA-dihydrouridine synthase B